MPGGALGSRQVARDPGGRHLRHPSLAPNGLLLVATAYEFASADIDNSTKRPGAIALYDTSSAGRVRDLTAGPGDSYPSFAPDGKSVAFQRGGGVWTVRTSGGKPKRLLQGRQPTWSK